MKAERVQFRGTLLPEWKIDRKKGCIQRQYQFSCHLEAMAFTDRVSEIAWEMGHLPVIVIDDFRVFVQCTTQETGSLSEKDFELAEKIEDLVASCFH